MIDCKKNSIKPLKLSFANTGAELATAARIYRGCFSRDQAAKLPKSMTLTLDSVSVRFFKYDKILAVYGTKPSVQYTEERTHEKEGGNCPLMRLRGGESVE